MKNIVKYLPELNDRHAVRSAFKETIYAGIDFGTSNSVVSVCFWNEEENGISITTLKLDDPEFENQHLVPTVIYVDKEQESSLIGEAAKAKLLSGAATPDENYFSSFKMRLGTDEGASYHNSVLLKAKDSARNIINKIGGWFSGQKKEEKVDDTGSSLYFNNYQTFLKLTVGRTPLKDVTDGETGRTYFYAGQSIQMSQLSDAGSRFLHWEFHDNENLPDLQNFTKERFGKYIVEKKPTTPPPPSGEKLIIDSPKTASAFFLSDLKNRIEKTCSEKFPGMEIKYSASIPASFGSNHRDDLKWAMHTAGIPVEDKVLIDEPNAAFLSWISSEDESDYLFEDPLSPQRILVFDFGAGTCDVSIVESRRDPHLGRFQLKNLSISKFAALGGDDFDREIGLRILMPMICEQNGLDEDSDITPSKYNNYFSRPLSGIAEQIKIQISKEWDSNPLDLEPDKEFKINKEFLINYQGEELSLLNPSVKVEDFRQCIDAFIKSSSQETTASSAWYSRLNPFSKIKRQTIFELIDEALGKVQLDKTQIHHLVFIGGSSNIPQVQESLEDYFEGNANPVYPEDMQSHVSKGVAMQSFLSHGMDLNPITEILAESLFLQLKEGQKEILAASSEIPIANHLAGSLWLNRKGQRTVEMPFYSGLKDKPEIRRVVANLTFKIPKNFDHKEEIHLLASIDKNKIVDLHASTQNHPSLVSEKIAPLSNETLDDYGSEAKTLIKNYNDAEASGRDGEHFIQSLITLHQKHGNHDACLNLYMDHFPDDFINMNYHASKAGKPKLRKRFIEKAVEKNPCGTSYYNLGLEYEYNDSAKYEKYMKLAAIEYNNPGAKFRYGKLIKKTHPDKSKTLIEEAFQSYYKKFQDDKKGLEEWQYWQLSSMASYLGKQSLVYEIDKIEEKLSRKVKREQISHGQRSLLSGQKN